MAEIKGLQKKEGRLMPFYSPEETYTCGCYGAKYAVFSPNTAFLPFILTLPLQEMKAFSVLVSDADTGKNIICVSSSDIPHKLYLVDGVYNYVYSGEDIPGLRLADYQRYVVTMLGFKSCPIVAAIDTDCLVKLELGNAHEVYGLPYHRGWLQWVYLDCELNSPTIIPYKVEEKDDLGRNTVKQSRLESTWNIELFDLPEWVYRTLQTAPILDTIILSKGVTKAVADQKRGSATLDKGITCENSLVLSFPDATNDATDGLCPPDDRWEDQDNELAVEACFLDVWVDTGRSRCLPLLPFAPCNPAPVVTAYGTCESGAGQIVINAHDIPDGETILYSIDDGSSYLHTNVFNNLPSGDYLVRILYQTAGCFSEPLRIVVECGDLSLPVWQSTGSEFCLTINDLKPNWQTTGNEFCLIIPTSDDGFGDWTLEQVCKEVQLNSDN